MIYFIPVHHDYGPIPYTEPVVIRQQAPGNKGMYQLHVALHGRPILNQDYNSYDKWEMGYRRVVQTLYSLAEKDSSGLFDLGMEALG